GGASVKLPSPSNTAPVTFPPTGERKHTFPERRVNVPASRLKTRLLTVMASVPTATVRSCWYVASEFGAAGVATAAARPVGCAKGRAHGCDGSAVASTTTAGTARTVSKALTLGFGIWAPAIAASGRGRHYASYVLKYSIGTVRGVAQNRNL